MSAPVCVLFGSIWIGLLLRRVASASHGFVYGFAAMLRLCAIEWLIWFIGMDRFVMYGLLTSKFEFVLGYWIDLVCD